MNPALAIICCFLAMIIIFTGLLAYACVRVGTRSYPRKPENKDAP